MAVLGFDAVHDVMRNRSVNKNTFFIDDFRKNEGYQSIIDQFV